jgi:hypothetical protein
LGGVTPHQVYATYAALLSFLFFVANAGLLCSVLAQSTRSASLWMVLASIAYPLAMWLSYQSTRWLGVPNLSSPAPHWPALFECSFFYRLGTLLGSGLTVRIVDWHEMIHVAAGLACFLLAWWMFPWATREPDAERTPRGLLGFRVRGRWRMAPGRVWDAAIVWKEFHFLLGGWPMLALKATGYFALWLGLWLYWRWWDQPYGDPFETAVIGAVTILSVLLPVEAAVLASRVFSDEIRAQTWALWMLTSESLAVLAYRKVTAALVGLLPVIGVLGVLLVFTKTGRDGLEDVLDEPMFWGIVSLFVTFVHFSAWYSLYVRWGAIPLAAASVIGPFVLFVMMVEASRIRPDEDAIGAFLCVVSLGVCCALHRLVGVRLRELAAQ